MAHSQTLDTVLRVQEITVQSTRLAQFSNGSIIVKSDSTVLLRGRQTVGEILPYLGNSFVKSYGLGSLATVSMRGAGASHTAILWNGFNLQSPMNGQFDLNLLGVTPSENLTVVYGGEGALWGSGAIGGAILLDQKPTFAKGFNLGVRGSGGSFDNFSGGLDLMWSDDKQSHQISLQYREAENDFRYANLYKYGFPIERQTNARFGQRSLNQLHSIKIGSRQKITLRHFYQDSYRQIPPSLSVENSVAFQEDESHRIALVWELIQNKSIFKVRSGWFRDEFVFGDENIGLRAESQSVMWISEAEQTYFINRQNRLHWGVHHQLNQAEAANYTHLPTQQRIAAFAAYRYSFKNNKANMVASVRQELLDGKVIPTMPSLGIEMMWLHLKWRGKVARTYRVPTFNDLYWQPGGNPDLKPEQGWTQELGVNEDFKIKTIHGKWSATAFSSQINDWILWSPNGNFWSADNVLAVWSRGVEGSVVLDRKYNKSGWSLQWNHGFTKSTYEEVAPNAGSSIGKQLVYVPLHNGSVIINYQIADFRLQYTHQYTSKIFTTTSNSSFLEGYQVGNILVNYHLKQKKVEGNIFFKINNIWNVDYQVIDARPMPRTYFDIGFNF